MQRASRPRPAASRVRPSRAAAVLPALDGVVVTAAGIEAFDCPICEDPRDLIRPDCSDDHDDCPDRACAVCGFAVVIGSAARDATRPAPTPSGMTA